MNLITRWMFVGALLLASGAALAHGGGAGDETVTPLVKVTLPEGVPPHAVALRVEFAPGATSTPHTHPGPAFVVVVEGELESAMGLGPVQRFKAGDAWYEASGDLHRVARNASSTQRAVLVAWLLSDGQSELVSPAP
ncbi:MAG TPA: cupin domain-containing protein [Pseudomonas sp.]|nr:cupin domain-containing protein [Pseudomonas sp.]